MNESTISRIEQLKNKLKTVKHPAIDHTLSDLGILKIKDTIFEEKNVSITMAFPFQNIPIADQLIKSVCDIVKESEFKCNVKTTVMKPQEKQRFLQMEKTAWTG
jgi:metal-sulfur cluster biosynthetic enzyme